MTDPTNPSAGPTPRRVRGSGGGDAIFELAPVGLAEVAIDGALLRVNAQLRSILGYAAGDELPLRLWDVIVPEEVREAVGCVAGLLSGAATRCDFDQRWRTKSGGRLWVAVSLALARHKNGKPDRLLVAVDDISDRKEVEQRVGVQHAVSVALASAESADGAITGVLEAIGHHLGWTFASFWAPADGETLVVAATWHEPGAELEEFDRVTRTIHLKRGEGIPGAAWGAGEPRWFDDVLAVGVFPRRVTAARARLRGALAFPVQREGRLLGVIELLGERVLPPDRSLLQAAEGIGHQLGQFLARREAADAERAVQARNAAMLEAALDCIVTIDHTGRILEFNPAAERTFGVRRADVVGRAMVEVIIPPAMRDAHRRGMSRYLATGEARVLGKRLELSAVRADGSEFPVELTITRVELPGPPVFTAFLRDLTERRGREARERLLIKAGEMLGSSLDYEATLRGLTDLIVPALADWYIVDLAEGGGTMRRLVVAHREPAKVAIAEELRRRYPPTDEGQGVAHVIRTGASELVSEISDAQLAVVARDAEHRALVESLGFRSYMIVPMTARGAVVGAITLVVAESSRRYDADDLAFAEDLARRAGQAVENARLYAAKMR